MTGGSDGTKIWETAGTKEYIELKEYVELSAHAQRSQPSRLLYAVAFSPDSQRLITGSGDLTAKVWDRTTGQELFTLKGHGGDVSAVAFSSDGQRIITGSQDQAKVWEAATGKELRTLKGPSGQIHSVAFSRDGRRIVTGSYDGTARVWEAATPQQVAVWRAEDKAKEKAKEERLAASSLSQARALQAAGKLDEAESLMREERVRQQNSSIGFYARLVAHGLGRVLVAQNNPTEAEPLLREALEETLKTSPDSAEAYDVRSLLGAALLEQKLFEAAEPLLLEGYEGLRRLGPNAGGNGMRMVPDTREAAERLVQLYEAWGKPAQAAAWKQTLEALPKPE